MSDDVSAPRYTADAPSRFAREGRLDAPACDGALQGCKNTGSALRAPSPAKRGRVREGARRHG
jgi:hypothetical protein